MGKTKHTGPIKLPKTLAPDLWVSKVPFGLGKVKPHHIRETMKVVWHNKDNLNYAKNIITKGVCDGCALGVSGLYDQTLAGPHVCTTRLNVLRLNTMPAMKEEIVHADIDELRKYTSAELRELGRIPYPLIRRPGERKFSRIDWDEAMDMIANKMKKLDPKNYSFFLTSRGITNESYYVAAKVSRFLGTNNIDNASRICHSPSKTALKRSLGIGASSCNYKDWIGSDVIVFWGSVAANNQPVSTKYMYAAKRKGTKIICINPYREPAMENYWIPSVGESALFGTKLADDFYQVNIGGDIAFMHGIMKHWFEMEEEEHGSAIDHDFVQRHVNGYDELKQKVSEQSWDEIVKSSGVTKERIGELALLLAKSKSGIFVWSLGLTMHTFASDNISQVANLAQLRGFLGREHTGVMPIRGHSSVQGSGEMGADPFVLPGGDFDEKNIERIEKLWNFELPKWQGDVLGVSLENCLLPEDHERKVKMYYLSGGNFLETMPDPKFIEKALSELEIRVHQDIIFNTSTLVDAKEAVIVLPAKTRYEQDGGGTSTSTERMVYFSPKIEGNKQEIEEARSEWKIYIDLAKRVKPESAHLVDFKDGQAIRDEMAKANPNYEGVQHLKKQGDVFQWGGAWLCEDGICPTPDGKGTLIPVDIPNLNKVSGDFYVTTRRGKQFNSMVYSEKDGFNDAERYDVLLNAEDAKDLSITERELVVVYNQHGVFTGKARFVDIARGNLEVHFPEGNFLLPKGVYEKLAKIPSYNVAVKLEKAERFNARKDIQYLEKKVDDLEMTAE
ncbi:formate dehydrogenase [Alkalihalobacillus alcalophilus ATCC 27647 = CGMCC 1.3604]|uniref:Formate dehydrogenase n=1 Tax=Alkalihalobacillus alcalophilus ATCC 27647 = CGMCC 1.3604 TaxID=1218173 RepID=A0A094WF59_ALKAL|nr:FdhF/YdeP family oxidoreductase [Alkalihalobacillus alcalophilus]KGA96389.1 formate dehydrogenase [Alkalihalobacillus alcalophilus ATCC 27647 = CGMCC 1.3604]MED1563215.1 FdhF/YdeP family oxidoreductase [Alkalihalobacillus alcalophilus]THG90004.1 formate dehydrogenase [Alkalihalobacillus alcalophilus ATCC 27647 = CGMCC 1.3604]